ncbi:MAG: hypothetical protein M3Q08_07830 [Pseudomonadota bacterium]|nr:hypothetical protein [Pseudomonadota bacterium]
MRNLETNELQYVSGAGSSPSRPSGCGCSPCPPSSRGRKGNNGFGNGADANRAAPGNSGKTGGGKEGSFGDDRGER